MEPLPRMTMIIYLKKCTIFTKRVRTPDILKGNRSQNREIGAYKYGLKSLEHLPDELTCHGTLLKTGSSYYIAPNFTPKMAHLGVGLLLIWVAAAEFLPKICLAQPPFSLVAGSSLSYE